MLRVIFLLLLLFPAGAFAGQDAVRVEAACDRKKATIGERIGYDLKVIIPDDFRLSEPDKAVSGLKWGVISAEISKDKDNVHPVLKYTLSAYTTGMLTVPDIKVKFLDNKGKPGEITVPGPQIEVESIIARTKEKPALRDITPPFSLPAAIGDYIVWGIVFVLIVAGLSILYKRYRKNIEERFLKTPPPAIPPSEIALKALQNLRNSGLVAEGRIKEYYITLSEIIRDFISGVYRIETRDMTTKEIITGLKKKEQAKIKIVAIKEFFEECDLVKFAKYRPEEKTCLADLETALNIVRGVY